MARQKKKTDETIACRAGKDTAKKANTKKAKKRGKPGHDETNCCGAAKDTAKKAKANKAKKPDGAGSSASREVEKHKAKDTVAGRRLGRETKQEMEASSIAVVEMLERCITFTDRVAHDDIRFITQMIVRRDVHTDFIRRLLKNLGKELSGHAKMSLKFRAKIESKTRARCRRKKRNYKVMNAVESCMFLNDSCYDLHYFSELPIQDLKVLLEDNKREDMVKLLETIRLGLREHERVAAAVAAVVIPRTNSAYHSIPYPTPPELASFRYE